jgi:hypothetical protein
MNENPMAQGTSTGEDTSAEETPLLDAQAAAAILAEAGQHARAELRVKRPLIFASVALAWLLGYGAIWLSVRGQHPYQGPTPPAAFALVVLVGVAVTISVSLHSRALSGVGGLTGQRRRIGVTALGGWLIAVAAGAAFAGPVGVWGVMVAAGAAGYLLAAVIHPQLGGS